MACHPVGVVGQGVGSPEGAPAPSRVSEAEASEVADVTEVSEVSEVPLPEASAPAEPETPNRVANEIVRWFTAAGYQRFQAEALADHARIESGFNPCIRGVGSE